MPDENDLDRAAKGRIVDGLMRAAQRTMGLQRDRAGVHDGLNSMA